MRRYRITVSSRSARAMVGLARELRIHLLDHGVRRGRDAGDRVQALATDEEIHRLESAGYIVERHEDVEATGRDRQKEVGKGDRYKQRPPD